MVCDWPVEHVAAAVVGSSGGVLGTAGEQDRVFPLASVTKLIVAYAVLIAVEEGAVGWEQPAGPEGATVRHLAAHASGLNFGDRRVMAQPGTRRIYSRAGFEVLAETVAAATCSTGQSRTTSTLSTPATVVGAARGVAGG
jgi:CubicO group peptidase (beta-lactamase class C family)